MSVSFLTHAPTPTGRTLRWEVDGDTVQQLIPLLEEIAQLQEWGDEAAVTERREALKRLPGFPRDHQIGDHLQVAYVPKVALVVRRV